MPQLHILGRQIIHFLGPEVVPITIVVGSIPPDATPLDRVLKLENLVLQVLELLLAHYDSFYYVVSVEFVLYRNICQLLVKVEAFYVLLYTTELRCLKVCRNLFQPFLKLVVLSLESEFFDPREPSVKLLDSIPKVLNFLLQLLLLVPQSGLDHPLLFSLVVYRVAISVGLDLPIDLSLEV